MRLQFLKADIADVLKLNGISKRAFDSDAFVGGPSAEGPPGYMSVSFHTEMAKQGHLYKLTEDGRIVGGAILFLQGDALNIGRIFVAPEYFRKGFGSFMMQEIESMFPGVKEFTLDTRLEYQNKFFLYKTGIYGNKAGRRFCILFEEEPDREYDPLG